MTFKADNRALRDAVLDGRKVLLFSETRKVFVRYDGEAACIGFHETRGPDRRGQQDHSVSAISFTRLSHASGPLSL